MKAKVSEARIKRNYGMIKKLMKRLASLARELKRIAKEDFESDKVDDILHEAREIRLKYEEFQEEIDLLVQLDSFLKK